MVQKSCIFCKKSPEEIILENDKANAFYDIHPMSRGHLLIVPKQHFVTWFDIPENIQMKMIELMNEGKKLLDDEYHPRGYQMFSHVGKISGQKVPHAHIHLVPVY